MLIVTRKVGEHIIIGDNVTVSVERITGGMVRIGIDAPADFSIVRRELIDGSDVSNEPRPSSTRDE